MTTPAGWYPSPGHDGHVRYWDGQRWTEHEQPAATTGSTPAATGPPAAPATPAAPSAPAAPATPASMAAGWYPVQGQPGMVRWWDGTRWAESTQPIGGTAVPVPVGTDGKLVAAGVITIIQSVLAIIAGLLLLVVSQSDVGRFADSLTGGALTFISLVVLIIGIVGLIAGINACRGRSWARILVIVLQSITVLFTLISLGSGDEGAGGSVVSLAVAGTALVLAVLGKPRPS